MNNSLFHTLLQSLPNLKTQIYFKSSLTALSHAMEDLVLAGVDRQPLVIASFQEEQFYRQEVRRYHRIAQRTDQVYVLAASDSDGLDRDAPYVTIPFDSGDRLAQEWHVIILGQQYSSCIICQEYASPVDAATLDQARQFRGIWTFDRQVTAKAAQLMLTHILQDRPDLDFRIQKTLNQYNLHHLEQEQPKLGQVLAMDVRLFTDRLVTYLQASQYKQIKTYRTLVTQERNQRLLNSITGIVRRSLRSEEILLQTVQEVGRVFRQCRCLLYCHTDEADQPPTIEFEAVPAHLPTLRGKPWSLGHHPLFQDLLTQNQTIALADVNQDLSLNPYPNLKSQLQLWQVGACLLVPISYQNTWLGTLEIHQNSAHLWGSSEVNLVEAIAAQVGIALIQSQSYINLESLNHQLSNLEKTQRNLIAIIGHELRTPLSAIQVCLDSFATTPDMPKDSQQIMLDVALESSERLRQLIQDFLTLSKLESGLIRWQPEPVCLSESVDLVISKLRMRNPPDPLPQIIVNIPRTLPLIEADNEALLEVLSKLIDNACKFTPPEGQVFLQAQVQKPETKSISTQPSTLEIKVTDTGRGIEPSQLNTIFNRFYQEEGFLQRSVGGTGLGLAICRRIVMGMGGTIWAESAGKNQGSTFYFTVPLTLQWQG